MTSVRAAVGACLPAWLWAEKQQVHKPKPAPPPHAWACHTHMRAHHHHHRHCQYTYHGGSAHDSVLACQRGGGAGKTRPQEDGSHHHHMRCTPCAPGPLHACWRAMQGRSSCARGRQAHHHHTGQVGRLPVMSPHGHMNTHDLVPPQRGASADARHAHPAQWAAASRQKTQGPRADDCSKCTQQTRLTHHSTPRCSRHDAPVAAAGGGRHAAAFAFKPCACHAAARCTVQTPRTSQLRARLTPWRGMSQPVAQRPNHCTTWAVRVHMRRPTAAAAAHASIHPRAPAAHYCACACCCGCACCAARMGAK